MEVHDPASLFGHYAHLFDDGRAEEFATLFTEDGVMLANGVEQARGRPAIADLARAGHQAMPGIRHFVSSIAVEAAVDGETALATAYVQAWLLGTEAVRLLTVGRYTAKLARRGDGWLFREHRLETLLDPALRSAELAAAKGAS